MHQKSNYRGGAGAGRDGSLWHLRGFRYLHLGLLSAMVWAGTELQGEGSGAATATGGTRILSPEIIEAVIQKLPKYAPPAPAKTPSEQAPDETDHSSRDILHLPKLTVKERPPTLPPTFDLLTPKGRLELALKNHPGLRNGNYFGMNNGIALAMQAEERKLEQKTALTETVRRTTRDESPDSKRLLRLINDAFRGPNNDWATSGGPMK
jgi:hypothetical protein